MQHVFIIGAKSFGAYGGYETFVNKLTEYHKDNEKIKYHIACKANGDGCMIEDSLNDVEKINESEFIYQNAHCFKISVPKMGSAVAIYYDVAALKYCCDYIEKNHINNPIIYILACRIGPFVSYFKRRIHSFGGKLYLNPDGHEWKRQKWNYFIRKYWKISEKFMIKHADLIVCDSVNIEEYVIDSYKRYNPKTTFISYGAEIRRSSLSDDDSVLLNWYNDREIRPKEYYLVVGRFVPENNYEVMIREFMNSNTKKDFVIVTNVNDKFLEELECKLHYKKDKRIKFVGTVYEQELLMKIRENAYGYFHGHEVGGTNPSLLEALGSTKLNLLLDVSFNREVGEGAALYWKKEHGSLSNLIEQSEAMSEKEILKIGLKAKKRISDEYSWEKIADLYQNVFLSDRF